MRLLVGNIAAIRRNNSVIDRLVKQDIIGPSEAKTLVLSRNGIMPVPTYDGLFNPLLRAMRELGGSASVSEQEDKVAELLNLSEEEASEIHRGNRTKLSYRLAWERLSRAHAVVYFVGYDTTAARRDAAKKALDTAQKLQPNSPETQRTFPAIEPGKVSRHRKPSVARAK